MKQTPLQKIIAAERRRERSAATPKAKTYAKHPDGSELERAVMSELQWRNFPPWERDYTLWRPNNEKEIDFAWKDRSVGLECQGIDHTKSRTYARDIKKFCMFAASGWRVLMVTTVWLEQDPDAFFNLLQEALDFRPL